MFFMLVCCDKPKDTVCSQFCNMRTDAVSQDAENQLCSVHDDNLAMYEAKCSNACSDVVNYFVDPAEQKDANSCLKCIVDNVSVPQERDFLAAKETCYEECNNLGGYQFFFSFYVSPPRWDCE